MWLFLLDLTRDSSLNWIQ